jgi:hypothetical protein
MTKSTGVRFRQSLMKLDGEIAYVMLSQNMEAKIDVTDVDIVSQRKWHASKKSSGLCYASSKVKHDSKSGQLLMHRLIMSAETGQVVDHINGNGLDNRRSNLRICSHSENMKNRTLDKRNQFGMKGVSARGLMYRATIQNDGKTIDLGTYITDVEAAAAYRGAAKALWGNLARDE